MTPTDFSPLANHLWQSTVCVAVAWVLALALRRNRAAVRYWVWFAASVKFLVPFAWLAAIGSRFEWRAAAPAITHVRIPVAVAQIGQPFGVFTPEPALSVGRTSWSAFFVLLLAIWLCGVFIGLVFWARSVWRMRAILRCAKPLDLHLPIPVVTAPGRLEPGVFGIWKPALLLPEGIAERLTPEQLEAVLAHELRHVHRRDNLTAAIHMLVETVFWFHPTVWWIRARLVEEREHACDEGALRMGSEPHVYAESILKVCEFYLSAPVCAAGVTGGELKKRIEGIIENRFGLRLGPGKRALLTAAALGAVSLPLALGLLHAATQAEDPAALHRFGVASIKTIVPGSPVVTGIEIFPGGRVEIPGESLKALIATAFHMSYRQISGGDEWTTKDLYNIVAKPPEERQQNIKDLRHTLFDIEDEHLREMVQALLIDRFQLKYHRETKTGDVYLLERSGKTLKLHPTEVTPAAPDPTNDLSSTGSIGYAGGKWRLFHTSMPQLAKFASDYVLHVPVLDRTELSGPFEYWQAAPDDEPAYAGQGNDDSFLSMLSTVGLKLERSKGPVETLVIDHAEKPTPD
jgi:uncharacterized protein (TIGR03435 family)